ncbi:hypothetical protein [Photorhabdus heterorhabditis]|uniref:Cysteine dioxygenase n=1 Tax=Photorhabdus heterorhabditis TaxID=880156 RepID=A0A5B0X198_9GAMM|nr:hypothetical protein [Photorhabdus heterorhabditis]KAA1192131.1 hypothetical protein F0L16_08650 [Photorhabdus heterorhabditis]
MTAFAFSKIIGDTLYHQWEQVRFDIDTFPSLAYQAITTFKPEHKINVFDIPFELLDTNEIPTQRINQGSLFGQPPLTLYVAEDRKFFIEIYLWSSVDMTIHDHPFSGAFTVLEGVCRHDTYLFDKTGGTSQLQTGNLTLKETELLSKGDCRRIFNGDRLIHRNLHLSKPTVTFIIRTFKEPGFIGMIFEESGLAVAPDLSAAESKFLDYLDGVLRLNNHDAAYRMIQSLVDSNCSDYAKYRSAEIYLEHTQHYHDVDLLSDMLSTSISSVTSDIFRKTFLLQRTRYLNGDEQHLTH